MYFEFFFGERTGGWGYLDLARVFNLKREIERIAHRRCQLGWARVDWVNISSSL